VRHRTLNAERRAGHAGAFFLSDHAMTITAPIPDVA
jgi:hypothetical protein